MIYTPEIAKCKFNDIDDEFRNFSRQLSQSHAWWWLSFFRRQNVSNYGIGCLGSRGPFHPRRRISTICVILIKKYIFSDPPYQISIKQSMWTEVLFSLSNLHLIPRLMYNGFLGLNNLCACHRTDVLSLLTSWYEHNPNYCSSLICLTTVVPIKSSQHLMAASFALAF